MRELSKKSTILLSNRQVTFQIDWISSQNENFLVDFRNCQIESKTCQLFFSVCSHRLKKNHKISQNKTENRSTDLKIILISEIS